MILNACDLHKGFLPVLPLSQMFGPGDILRKPRGKKTWWEQLSFFERYPTFGLLLAMIGKPEPAQWRNNYE
jgi:hypothetical protein